MSEDWKHYGKLETKYTAVINPFTWYRASKCPQCEGRAQVRKFALVIHVDPKGIFHIRTTCKWCIRCELVIVHQHELEHSLEVGLREHAPDQVGNEYLLIGTLEMRIWTRYMKHQAFACDPREWTSDFLNVTELQQAE